ncbi:hypothetical protein [uncultured Porticoccus sp.]|uniref:hypothetical protein n=1 Tax=uncultured Porticoccus sp. TaxID=1256050 RepID=UPI002628E8BD|nr:hypothetical protein [uncultured Porticoccus sp.]
MTIDSEAANNLRPVTSAACLFSVPGTLYLAMADKSLMVLLALPIFFAAAFVYCLVFFLLALSAREVISSIGILIESLMERAEKG